MRLPYYISDELKAYVQMSSNDRRALLDMRLFDTDPLTCNASYLPLLANEVGVEIGGFDETDARALIQGAREALLHAGTKASIERALDGVCDVKVKEHSNFLFDLDLGLADKEITPALVRRLESIARDKKNVRSHMNEFRLGYLVSSTQHIATGGVGEAACSAVPLEGYENLTQTMCHIAAGGVGEVSITIQGGV